MNDFKLIIWYKIITPYFVIFSKLLTIVKTSGIWEQEGAFEQNAGNVHCKPGASEFNNHCYFMESFSVRQGSILQDLTSTCSNYVLSNVDECTEFVNVSGLALESDEERKFIRRSIFSSPASTDIAITSGYWSCGEKENAHVEDFCGIWYGWGSLIIPEEIELENCEKMVDKNFCSSNKGIAFYYILQGNSENFWTPPFNEANKNNNMNPDSIRDSQTPNYVICEYQLVKKESCLTETSHLATNTDDKGVTSVTTSESTTEAEYTKSSGVSTTDGFETTAQLITNTDNNGVTTIRTNETTIETENTASTTEDTSNGIETTAELTTNTDDKAATTIRTSEAATETENHKSSTENSSDGIETTGQGTTNADDNGITTLKTNESTTVTGNPTSTTEGTADGNDEDCILCQETDDYGMEWKTCSGEVLKQSCPYEAKGYAWWKCGKDGLFEGDAANYSECHNRWIADLEGKVKGNLTAEKIGEIFMNNTLKESFFGHEILQHVYLLSNITQLFQKQTANYNATYTEEEYTHFTITMANITNNVISIERPWKQITKEERAKAGSKLQDFLCQIGFSLMDTIFTITSQNYIYLAYSFSNLHIGMQLTSINDSSNILAISYPKDSLVKSGNITVYGEPHAKKYKYPEEISSVGTIFEPETGKRLFPEAMKSWRETEMLLNSAVISFELQEVSVNKMNLTNKETADKHLKIESVIVKLNHYIPAGGPSEQLIRRDLFAGESPAAVIGHAKCVFWNKSTCFGRWDESGCEVVTTNEDFTICNCSHLSSFGVFMSIHRYENKGLVMDLLSWTCSGLSIICLILTLAVFQVFKKHLHGERETICKHICICLLATHILSVTVLDKKYFNLSDRLCSCVGALLHFLLSSGLMWMAAEGYHLYRMVLYVMDETGRDLRKTYCIISYGLPVLVVGITAMIGYIQGEKAYGNPELCWLSLSNYQWIFISQALLITMVNTFVLILALRTAAAVGTNKGNSTSRKIGIWLRGWFTLSSLLGVTWFFGIAAFDINVYFEYVFVALNGSQGVLIFVSRILQNEQVRIAVRKRSRKQALLKNFYMNMASPSTRSSSTSENIRE